jgi:hypothetical protein
LKEEEEEAAEAEAEAEARGKASTNTPAASVCQNVTPPAMSAVAWVAAASEEEVKAVLALMSGAVVLRSR